MTLSYETAVYVEDVKALTDEIVALPSAHRIRSRGTRSESDHRRGADYRSAGDRRSLAAGALEARRHHGHDPAHRR